MRPPGLLAILLLWLALPATAFAHATLVGADPTDGAVLPAAPARFSLSFNEPVSPLALTLIGPDAVQAKLDSSRVDGGTLVIDAPKTLPHGTHVLSWRVVSADGHPVAGSLIFSVGAPSATPVAVEPVDWQVRSAVWAARVLLYAGLFLGVGGVFALAWLAEGGRAGTRAVLVFLILGIMATVLALGLQGVDALGVPLAHLAKPMVWQTGFATSYGLTVSLALAAQGLALLALIVPASAGVISPTALAVAGMALAASGHASAAEPQWLMRPMVFLHGAGIMVWAGVLVPLGATLLRRDTDATTFLLRFSRIIPVVLAVLVGAGVVLAVVQVGTPAALLETAYGRLLLIKLALLAVLFVLAAFNRWRLTARVVAGDVTARKRLLRSIVAETLIVLAILCVAAGWRFTPPPRALAIAAAQPASIHIHTLQAMADLSVTPGHAGPVEARIVIMTGDFGPLDAREVTLVLSKPDAGIEPLKRAATKSDDGTWRVNGLVIPFGGKWNARLDILISDFDMAQIEGLIDIRP